MIICSQPECQTTAGCTCTNRLFDYSRLRGEVTAKSAEISALKKQVEELTAERDRLNGCLNLANERTDENFDQAVKSAFIAAKLRRENEALRKALEFYADVSKYPAPLTGGMGDLWADCGQIARTALIERGADLPV